MKKFLLLLALTACNDGFLENRVNAQQQRIIELQEEIDHLQECIQRLDLAMDDTAIVIALRECTWRSRR